MTNECIVWVKTWCSSRCTLKIGHLNADVVCIFVFFFFKSSCEQHGVDVDDDDWTPSPQSFHLPMCVAAGKPPSAGHITWVPTGQVCGPEIRPNPLGPESHPDTHITLWDLQLTQRGSQIIWIDHHEQRRHFLSLRLSHLISNISSRIVNALIDACKLVSIKAPFWKVLFPYMGFAR